MIGPTPTRRRGGAFVAARSSLPMRTNPDYSEANAPYYIYPDGNVIVLSSALRNSARGRERTPRRPQNR